MNRGNLSQYFTSIAAKRLSAVEADTSRSNQHEFNGVQQLVQVLGVPQERRRYDATFVYVDDDQDDPLVANAYVTWYDARARDETRTEYRLYFPTSPVSESACEGDLLVIARRPDDTVMIVIASHDSTALGQIAWLFGLENLLPTGFTVRASLDEERDRLTYVSARILEAIGIETAPPEDNYLTAMIAQWEGLFPSTVVFSEFARSTLPEELARDAPDEALIQWMEREETLFRSLERHCVAERLEQGFAGDIDGFLRFSLSVQNRRKSRVGLALENHVEYLLTSQNIRFTRGATTENRSRPDFLFPGVSDYRDPEFPVSRLTMLAAKSTCKDRWRQVLAEADRIQIKHLLTLESSISPAQTDEMKAKDIALVLPRSLHATFTVKQQSALMDMRDFIALVRQRQQDQPLA